MAILHTSVSCATNQWTWEQRTQEPFDELILSWNGFRPNVGFWEFSVSLWQNGWSPWLKYAEWGAGRQKTFRTHSSVAHTDQDIVKPKAGSCTALRIQGVGCEGADLSQLHGITVALSNTHLPLKELTKDFSAAYLTEVPLQSQMILPHPRCHDLCSPTATSAAINFLRKTDAIDPIRFSDAVRDHEFDIYGNWVLNTAAAYDTLQGTHRTYVARLPSFSAALQQISRGLPVVVSIKGPLEGAPLPYANGHLMLLTGYDKQRVFCMDPGYPNHASTKASYPLYAFLEAWGRRRNLAYLFD
jgi:hypothetical protein